MTNRMIKQADRNSGINMRNAEQIKLKTHTGYKGYVYVPVTVADQVKQRINAAIDSGRDRHWWCAI